MQVKIGVDFKQASNSKKTSYMIAARTTKETAVLIPMRIFHEPQMATQTFFIRQLLVIFAGCAQVCQIANLCLEMVYGNGFGPIAAPLSRSECPDLRVPI